MLRKTFIKINLIICVTSIVLFAFLLGYFVGIEIGQENVRKQELVNLEQRLDELDSSKVSVFFDISKDDDPVLGDSDTPLSIIEFSNFQCKFCLRFYSDTLPLLKIQYIDTGKVNLIYRDFTLPQIYTNSVPAALASECADEQGNFWEYHDMLFEEQNSWRQNEPDLAISTFKQFATTLNLDQEKFDSCLDSGKFSNEVNSDVDDGRVYGVSGTPTFFIGNEKLGYSLLFGTQSFSDFQIILDKKLSDDIVK